ncbi:MAG: cytochrome C oxidase subunit IV family protein [Acidimicrobiales bacterium]|jgi:cytochrome c oxidase subunit 4|nr:cytochrome C oxidase subunit IV family protein [Acidimicrobiales bacterium]
MSTLTADNATDAAPPHDDVEREKLYVIVALVLAALTAIEVATYFAEDFVLWGWGWGDHENFGVISVLMLLMAVKFWMVAGFFMHLRFDKKLLSGIFYSGLALALLVYIAVLLAFRIFDSGGHMSPL